MLRYLISCSLAISCAMPAVCGAASVPQQSQTQVPAHPVSQRPLDTAVPAQPPAPRHLTEQQRAELRRQLEQFNRQYNAKGK